MVATSVTGVGVALGFCAGMNVVVPPGMRLGAPLPYPHKGSLSIWGALAWWSPPVGAHSGDRFLSLPLVFIFAFLLLFKSDDEIFKALKE